MPSWNDMVAELRAEFIRGSLRRLEEADHLLELLEKDPRDQAALRDLMRRFHGFAGSGSTYGFPGVTRLGEEAEREAFGLMRSGQSPDAALVARWRVALDALRSELVSGTAGVAGEVSGPPARPIPAPFDILVVDDDEQVRRVLVRLLEDEGMAPRVATTRAEATSALSKIPDGIITDVRLPDGSGYALVDHLRAMPQGDTPAVVVLTMMSGLLDRVEAIHCGADAYFEKPVDWQALMRRLHHLLERRAEAGRVLSVEDDPDQAAFLRAVLESAGYEVRVCNDPSHFETELVSFRPDLVLMDIILPRLNGYDLVRYIRQDERYATLPVLFLSTEGQVEARIEGTRAGGDEHLVKPVAPSLLLWAVAARIERSRFLKSLLDRDGLTRLLTHTAFLERARNTIAQKRRNPHRSAAWVMIDLDDFKSINDRFGHPVGDRVLVSVSALLRRRLRQSDTIGRYGGEEFAVLIDDLPEEGAVRLVTRLLAEFAATEHPAGEESFRATFSAGIAMLDASMDLDDWRQAADTALYVAKEAGRNRVVPASTPNRGSSPRPSVARGRSRPS